jgi:hypothetical protein
MHDPPGSASWVTGITDMNHLICVFWIILAFLEWNQLDHSAQYF